MKKIKSPTSAHNIQFNTHKHRPENKDNLDSREGQEQYFKGDDITHNQKERKAEKLRKKKKG